MWRIKVHHGRTRDYWSPLTRMTLRVIGAGARTHPLRLNRLAIRRLPAPGSGPVAALGDALLIDLRNDLAVAGEQRLGRAHLRAQRQLALGEAVGAVFLE